MPLVATEANTLLAATTGQAVYTQAATQLALDTAVGNDTTAGTEVTGGGYGRQTVTWAAPSGKAIANSAVITYSNMPACTVTSCEVYSSSTRKWYGNLTTSRTLLAGDSLTFAIGALQLSMA